METLLLYNDMVTILVHYGPFWCIFVHFGAPHVWPHDHSMTCTDSYLLLSVHLIQKEFIEVTPVKFKTLLNCHDMVTILVHFDPFWCTLWATPWPLSIRSERGRLYEIVAHKVSSWPWGGPDQPPPPTYDGGGQNALYCTATTVWENSTTTKSTKISSPFIPGCWPVPEGQHP